MLKRSYIKKLLIPMLALISILIMAFIMWGWRQGAFSIMPLGLNFC